MLRDDLVHALRAQPHDEDVRVNIGGLLVDLVRVHRDGVRESVVLEMEPEDLESALRWAAQRPWWRPA